MCKHGWLIGNVATGRYKTLIHSRQVHEWFEGRPRLASALTNVVKLHVFEIDTANPCFYVAITRVHRHETRVEQPLVVPDRIQRTHGRIFIVASAAVHKHFHFNRLAHLLPDGFLIVAVSGFQLFVPNRSACY